MSEANENALPNDITNLKLAGLLEQCFAMMFGEDIYIKSDVDFEGNFAIFTDTYGDTVEFTFDELRDNHTVLKELTNLKVG